MAHARKTIRDRIVSDLTGLTTTGSNVFKSRVYPIASNLLPGLAIYTLGEQIDYASIGAARLQQRVLSVSVDVYVKGTSNYDDTLDQICLEGILVSAARETQDLACEVGLEHLHAQWVRR